MHRKTLNMKPPRAVASSLSLATYSGTRPSGYVQTAENLMIAQMPHIVLPQHYVPPHAYHLPPMQHPQHPSVAQIWSVADTRQESTPIRWKGIISTSCGKRFVRQVQFAERVCGFSVVRGCEVDVLGHHLTGMDES